MNVSGETVRDLHDEGFLRTPKGGHENKHREKRDRRARRSKIQHGPILLHFAFRRSWRLAVAPSELSADSRLSYSNGNGRLLIEL
jgi:hypothetical protein